MWMIFFDFQLISQISVTLTYGTNIRPDLARPEPRIWAWQWAWISLFLEISSLLARSLLPAASLAPFPRKQSLLRRQRPYARTKAVDRNLELPDLGDHHPQRIIRGWSASVPGLSSHLGLPHHLNQGVHVLAVLPPGANHQPPHSPKTVQSPDQWTRLARESTM